MLIFFLPPAKATIAALQPLNELATAVEGVLNDESRLLQKAADKADRQLKDKQKYLRQLTEEIKPLVIDRKVKFSPAEEDQVNNIRSRYLKFAATIQKVRFAFPFYFLIDCASTGRGCEQLQPL